jgi:hypothetical protein
MIPGSADRANYQWAVRQHLQEENLYRIDWVRFNSLSSFFLSLIAAPPVTEREGDDNANYHACG